MKKPLFFLLGVLLAAMLPTVEVNAQTQVFHVAIHMQDTNANLVYPIHDTLQYYGTAGNMTVVYAPDTTGFTPTVSSITINSLPSTDTVIDFYYNRHIRQVFVNLNGGAFTDGSATRYDYYYGQVIRPLSNNVVRENCIFRAWTALPSLTMTNENIVVSAKYYYHLFWTIDSAEYSGQAANLYAYYVDDNGNNQPINNLTFINNVTGAMSSSAVGVGNYTVTATANNDNYPIVLLDAVHSLKIKPFMLTVSGMIVDSVKLFDGNDQAKVVNPGTINKFGSDKVNLNTPTARFSDAVPGVNKSVVASLSISGTDAANYTIPDTMLVSRNGAIVDKIQLTHPNFNVDNHGYCESATIAYNLITGSPNQYMVTYTPDALANGFVNTGWQNITTPGSITIDIPASAYSQYYGAEVMFRNSTYPQFPSEAYGVTFHANMPTATVMALFSDVLAVVDTCGCYSDFQWYHNDNLIPGANEAWYQDVNGLSGTYHVRFKNGNGDVVWTCESGYTFLRGDEEVKLSAYPNPASDMVNLSISNSPDFNHTLVLMNVMGMTVLNTTFDGNNTNLDLRGLPQGTYTAIVDGMVVRVIKK